MRTGWIAVGFIERLAAHSSRAAIQLRSSGTVG